MSTRKMDKKESWTKRGNKNIPPVVRWTHLEAPLVPAREITLSASANLSRIFVRQGQSAGAARPRPRPRPRPALAITGPSRPSDTPRRHVCLVSWPSVDTAALRIARDTPFRTASGRRARSAAYSSSSSRSSHLLWGPLWAREPGEALNLQDRDRHLPCSYPCQTRHSSRFPDEQ